MDIFFIAGLVVLFAIVFYAVGLIAVWIFEIKRNMLHQEMQKKLRFLENFQSSSAVLYAKRYKVLEDYRRSMTKAEKAQRFILDNLLFIGRQGQDDVASRRNVSLQNRQTVGQI